MILDASAVIAVVLRESDTDRLQIKLSAADEVAIGAPSLVEVSIALTHRMGPAVAGSLVQSFLNRFEVSILAFEPRHWRVAIEAFRRYGKGRHPAALNFGDCLAYATARVAGRPLLATGDDFVKTDLVVA